MKKTSRVLALIMAMALILAAFSGCGAKTEEPSAAETPAYPTKDIQGSIMWSAGGVCDLTARSIGAAAQEILGQTIVFTNRPGAGGSVSTTYVDAQAADGYELLFGAENPQIAKVMGTAEIDYDNFTPVCIYCVCPAAVTVSKDSPYNTIEELMNAVLANPGKMIQATTGAGGLPQTMASMVTSVIGAEPNMVPFDGENECMTAIMGKNADYTITTLPSAASFYQSGDVKILAMMTSEPVEGYEDVPCITDSYPDFNKFLPWSPFYGVFVKNGTDEAVVATLADAFSKACEDKAFLELLDTKGCSVLNIAGDEAKAYIDQYRSVTSWLLYDSGVAEIDPSKFGIARP